MRSTVEPLEGNKVKVSVEVDEAEFDKAIDAAFRKIARQTRIPGFRPGKAPRRLLEARFGTDAAREEALRDALPDYYIQAIGEQDVDAIAPGQDEVSVHVRVKDVKEKVRPDVTDEWASEASEFETVDALSGDIRTRLGAVKRVQAQLALREQVVDALADLISEDMPEPL